MRDLLCRRKRVQIPVEAYADGDAEPLEDMDIGNVPDESFWAMDGAWDVPHSNVSSKTGTETGTGIGTSMETGTSIGMRAKGGKGGLCVFRLTGRRVAAAIPSEGEHLDALLS